MADAYLKVKDNGASGLELVRESVSDAENTLGVTALEDNLDKVIDETIDVTQTGNIYDIATDKLTGKYYNRASNNALDRTTNASWNGYIVKIYPDRQYKISVNSHIVLLDKNKTPINQTGLGWDYTSTSSFESSTAHFAAISYKSADLVGDLVLSEGSSLDDNDYDEVFTNIYSKAMDDTVTIKQNGNIYDIASDKLTGKYYNRASNNALDINTNSAWSGFIVKVYKNRTYTISVASNIVLLDNNKVPINQTGVGWDYQGASTISSGNAEYLAVSYKTADLVGSLVMSEGTALDSNNYSETYINIVNCDNDFSASSVNPVENRVITNRLEKISSSKTPYGTASGAFGNGEYIEINGRSALKDGETIVFKGFLSSFEKLRLAFMYAGGVSNYIDVDATNVTIKNNSSTASAVAHGLTITNDITIMVELIRGDAKITVISNGSLYTTTVAWTQISGVASSPRVISTNTVCTSSELRAIYNAVKRKVWFFGDSYISFNDSQKWVYYLKEYGFDTNMLLCGSSGCSSAITKTAFETLLNYGSPALAVMATGMNDGSDNGATPASTWTTNKNAFISICENANVEPVFCTIPTTPTVNNEAKNAWVKASGYRYIDFAKAVGAQSDGTWYQGMLANDNVHPTQLGARALFSQILIDLPEVTF